MTNDEIPKHEGMTKPEIRMPSAVIFDCDGVVVDTERMHYDAIQEVLRPLDMTFRWEQYEAEYMGFDDRDAFRHAFQSAGRPIGDDELRNIIAAKAAAFERLTCEEEVPVLPGVTELMQACEESAVPFALCTGSSRSDINNIFARISLPGTFAVQVTADDVSASKPDPESYRLCVERLMAALPDLAGRADRMVAIEDTPDGIAAAKGAGLTVLAVGTTNAREALTAADGFVSRLSEWGLTELGRMVG
jgi:HAD superfamily hydrolase (TIGR01509 family)